MIDLFMTFYNYFCFRCRSWTLGGTAIFFFWAVIKPSQSELFSACQSFCADMSVWVGVSKDGVIEYYIFVLGRFCTIFREMLGDLHGFIYSLGLHYTCVRLS